MDSKALVRGLQFLPFYLCRCKHSPGKQGVWACAVLQALGWLQKATGKSHVITLERTYAAILRLGMYTLTACPAALAQSPEAVKELQGKQTRNSPRTESLPTEGKA